ncbi:uncharacterized protein K489DRAFT_170404 [Dissoconium aciculare CBS 342.82]|uniref:Uncharacterized protein n=1 Tax=Dissoconium aciculare CBS 342.82 TaxID=1314786 RepID=A0A6J3MAX1_9PEZI|nr:uncharacterized protein K489DRAFT_170404 [Dissoconium aciculare CBS 342.82]KAF1823977.1 hypothetical protein K489DRAFT_170404 [Dissoconium aciculare CBS 342.82]
MFPDAVPIRARSIYEHKRSEIDTHTTTKPPSHQFCGSGAEIDRGWGTSGRYVDTCDSQTMPVVSPGTSSNQSVEERKARPQSLDCHCHLERGDDSPWRISVASTEDAPPACHRHYSAGHDTSQGILCTHGWILSGRKNVQSGQCHRKREEAGDGSMRQARAHVGIVMAMEG